MFGPVIGAATGSDNIELGSRAPVRDYLSHDPVQRVGGDTPRVIGITHVARERVAQHQRDNALRMGRGERDRTRPKCAPAQQHRPFGPHRIQHRMHILSEALSDGPVERVALG